MKVIQVQFSLPFALQECESKSKSKSAGAIFPPFDLAGQQTEVLQPKRRHWTQRALTPGLPILFYFCHD